MNDKKNILLITSDQHHFNALGFLNKEIKTPNLDRMAKKGIYFNRAYCCNPTCTPTRASIITGKYPSQHGAYSLGTKLPETEHTVGEDFLNAGYRTALIGKAHFQPLKSTEQYPSLEAYPVLQDLDFWRNYNETFYGFEHIELARNHADEAHVGQHYAIWLEEKGCNWRDFFRPPTGNHVNQFHKWNIQEEYHYDTWIAERTNSLLQEYSDNNENFFLWASFFDPHPPYLVPEPWDTMYDPEEVTVPELYAGEHQNNPPFFSLTQTKEPDFSQWQEPLGNSIHGFCSHIQTKKEKARNIATYYAMVSLMDKYIGVILDKLEELDLLRDTVIVFTTDHGHFLGQHGLIAKGPFHYEDLVKVPFIVCHPDVAGGDVNHSLQSLVDLAPTFLSLCGIDVPVSMTGIDQSESWLYSKPCRNHVVVENRHQPTKIHLKTYIDERYKLTVYYNQDYGELFDLKKDLGEVNNLWNEREYAELKNELIKKLLFAEMGKETITMPRIAPA